MGLLEGIMGKVPTSTETLAVSAGACIVGGIVGGLIMKRAANKSTDKLPEKWIKVGEIRQLLIYPIKGIPPVSVNEAAAGRLGLKATDNPHLRDRVFAIINEKGNCISQKSSPNFTIFAHTQAALLEDNKLQLSYIKDPSLDIVVDVPTTVDPTQVKIATIFGEKLKAVDCGDKVAAWLSNLTKTPGLRLLYHVSEEPQRGPVSRNTKFETFRVEDTGAFHDETSYMLMTDESVAALNSELEKPVSHANFRPTLVVKGSPEPFSEDFWGYIRIGSKETGVIMKGSRPCQRCTLTLIDPETATVRDDGEPLKTLYKMKRRVGDAKTSKLVSKAAIMGTHFGLFDGQDKIIRVGDPVYAALL